MKLVKIKNRYFYNSDNPNGNHLYAIYKDRKSKELRAVALTHIYNKDLNRFNQIRRGNIMVAKFKNYEVPSGVKNYYYATDINGNKIDLSNRDVIDIVKNGIGIKQSKKIKKFAQQRYEFGERVY